MEPIISFAKENQAALAVAIILLVPLGIIYQKKAAPIIFHSIEYVLYMTLMHYIVYSTVQVIAWYKSQTPDIRSNSGIPFHTPRNPISDNFFDKASYNPGGILYFEIVLAIILLYIVVVVRPATYASSNKYKGDKERGMHDDGKPNRAKSRYNRGKASGERSRKS